MAGEMNRKIVLEDGAEYLGFGFGANVSRVCEIVFNTSMAGYQEIVSDPSYTDQMVVMTYPLIGNYGMADEDYETKLPSIGALVVREYNDTPSNFRYTKTLSEVMEEYGIPGIYGVDTRKITRSIRDIGSRKAYICDASTPTDWAMRILQKTTLPTDAVRRVSCQKKWYSRTADAKYNVVAVDCGMKLNIVRSLKERGCNVTVVPYNTTAAEIEAMDPDGVFLSNGPGNPEDVKPVIELVQKLRGKYPMFGICLGHQIIGLAYGAKTTKMKFGHRGGNHPVKDLAAGRAYITSQNHGYMVLSDSVDPAVAQVSHVNVNDGTCEGLNYKRPNCFTTQFHPEANAGPKDTEYLFNRFIDNMAAKKAGGDR